MLINKGANVNAQNNKGNTPIHMAIGYDYYECAMLLIESKADQMIKNEGGFTAKTGIDGDKTLGLAALISAKTSDDVAYAFDLCEENIHEVNKANFVSAGMKAKKSLGSEWSSTLQERFKSLTQKL
jgi:ankyrin repeat protein